MLNKKGFTLIEVLMVISILGVILAIAVPSVYNYYEISKIKTEKIFVDKLTRKIDDYITMNVDEFELNTDAIAKVKKCEIGDITDCSRIVDVYEVVDEITFNNIITLGLIDENEFINPKNNKRCNKDSSKIEIYQDEDKVNYFRYTLVDCDISDENIFKVVNDIKYIYDNTSFLN